MSWKTQLDTIAADKFSGATDLTSHTARALCAMCETEKFASSNALHQTFQDVVHHLIAHHPEVAPLMGLLNTIFFVVTGTPDLPTALEDVCKAARTFVTEMGVARREVVNKSRGLLPADVTVLTHARSSTVAALLTAAIQSGRHLKVFCHESRPLHEGRAMATELSAAGIEVVFSVDATAYTNLHECELVLLGANSLTEQGLFNTIGTASIAVSAQTLGIPVYVLTDTTKVWPTRLGSVLVKQYPTTEIWLNAPADIQVSNIYYDMTPWQSIAGIITERGLLTPDEVRLISREKTVHRHLQTIVADVRSIL